MRSTRTTTSQRSSAAGREAGFVLVVAAGALAISAAVLGGAIEHLVSRAHGLFSALP